MFLQIMYMINGYMKRFFQSKGSVKKILLVFCKCHKLLQKLLAREFSVKSRFLDDFFQWNINYFVLGRNIWLKLLMVFILETMVMPLKKSWENISKKIRKLWRKPKSWFFYIPLGNGDIFSIYSVLDDLKQKYKSFTFSSSIKV